VKTMSSVVSLQNENTVIIDQFFQIFPANPLLNRILILIFLFMHCDAASCNFVKMNHTRRGAFIYVMAVIICQNSIEIVPLAVN